MADHERSTKHQRSAQSAQSEDSHKFENRSDRDDSYDYSHGSFRFAREERPPHQRYPQSDRGRRYSQNDSHRYFESENRLSGSVMKDHHWTSHDRPKTIHSRSHERFNRGNDVSYGRESSNGIRNTSRTTPNERRQIRGQERHDGKDEPEIVHEKRHQWDNKHLQKSHGNYNRHKEEERECQDAKKSPAARYSSSDVTSSRPRHKDRNNSDNLVEHHPYTADRRHQRGRPSSIHSLGSASDGTDDPREMHTPREGSSYGRRLSLPDGRRSPSLSGSPPRSESRYRGISSSSKTSVKKDSRYNAHSHNNNDKHGGKRKHRDRSASPDDDRRRRKHKEREREKEREVSRDSKEKMRRKDEERRSVLTGKKIKLKVKKDKGDHERDANRKDLLQFLNSAFE